MNKQQLEKLSDFEINQSVALELFNGSAGGSTDKSEVWCACMSNDCYGYFNPCNNWSDMGPLIDDNDISIVKDGSHSFATNHPQELYIPVGDKKHEVQITDKVKTLRAAAIVYLLMQEGV